MPSFFLHDRTTARGQTRLVMVGLVLKATDDADPQFTTRFNVVVRIFKKATWTKDAESEGVHTFGQGYGGEVLVPGYPIRIYAGKPDRADPSRFSIPWERNGQSHVIQGVLIDDVGEPRERLPRSPDAVTVRLENLP